jgi:hypothetical protein
MGRKPDLNTPAQYQIFHTYIGYKNGCAKCRHCAKVGIINTNRMKLHLTECQPYQQFSATETAERAAKKRRIDTNEESIQTKNRYKRRIDTNEESIQTKNRYKRRIDTNEEDFV